MKIKKTGIKKGKMSLTMVPATS